MGQGVSKKLAKRKKTLEARRAKFDATKAADKGHRKPGSMNGRKS